MTDSWKWGFTPGERSALLLICAALLVGLGYQVYQRHHAPALPPLTAADSLSLAALRKIEGADTILISQDTIVHTTDNYDLNTATCEQLEKLPGIGPTLARRIVTRRDSLGGFKRADDLLGVPGIGPKRLEKIRPLVTFKADTSR
jgi:competence ComEA-like helix-hairpin-helix protein